MTNSIVAFATRFAPRKDVRLNERLDVIDMEPIEEEDDLEVLAKMIEEATNRKVHDEAEALRSAGRAQESLEFRNKLVAQYEAVVAKRGLLCRK